MPLVQVAQGKRDWLKAVIVLGVSMAVVTAAWGAIVGAAGGALVEFVGSRRRMALILRPMMLGGGLVMLIIALGEFGLIRRLLPEFHPRVNLAHGGRGRGYGQVAAFGATIALTFGIICTLPPYMALLVYVAALGNAVYGFLALGAYGLGMTIPIALGGFALLPTTRSGRFAAWLAARTDAIHSLQGILFAFLGGAVVTFFWRYVIPKI